MAEFINNPVSTVQMNVPTNADGDIATTGEIQTGIKKVSIEGIKATATLAQAATVFDAFYGTIADTSFDSLSAKKTTVQGVI